MNDHCKGREYDIDFEKRLIAYIEKLLRCSSLRNVDFETAVQEIDKFIA